MSLKFGIPSTDSDLLCRHLGIQPEERVLEIGAGHRPFLRADVVVDLDFTQSAHRDGAAMVIEQKQRLYVQADLTALPFKDKSFDWVICLHVLEHVSEPAKACQELMRVAHKGFLETPRKWTEYYAGHPTHRWLIDDINGVLIFEPVDWLSSPFFNFALAQAWSSPLLLKSVEMDFRQIPCVQKQWHETFEYVVAGANPAWDDASHQALRHYHFAKNLIYWLIEPSKALFHAQKAFECDSNNLHFRSLYSLYLMLCGKYSKAWRINKNLHKWLAAWLAATCLRIVHKGTLIFRKLMAYILN